MEWDMRYVMLKLCVLLHVCLGVVVADPEFCNRGFKLASRFYSCWEQATYANKYPGINKQHDSLDSTFVEAYATHMCSVVKPQALSCLQKEVEECENQKKLMDIADKSGGACEGNHLNPYFKKHVTEMLVPIKGDSPCFALADNTYECYKAAGDKVMRMGGQTDDIVTFHRVADKFFDAYWGCMVQIYKSNIKMCPNWQIPMLLTLQKTAMPSLFGLRLQPSQVAKLELGKDEEEKGDKTNLGPSKLYLLLQLHKTKPDIEVEHEDSVVLELSDLNDENPRLELESEKGGISQEQNLNRPAFTLKEIKKLLREQRRRNKELKDFINQAQGLENRKSRKGKGKKSSGKKGNKGTSKTKSAQRDASSKTEKKLHIDSMVA